MEFGQVMRDGTNKFTPSFGKRNLRDEPLQITMVQDQLDGHAMSVLLL